MVREALPPREGPIDPAGTVLLLIDVQRGIYNEAARERRPYFHASATEIAIPNMQRLLAAARVAGVEVIHTVIASLTRDGRDRGLDYKQTGFHFPPGSEATRVIDALAPLEDEIVLPKTSSSVFNSTVFEYVLRNMGLDTVIVTGFLTDQCVDHTVRDGADRGFRMICPVDACTTDSPDRHAGALSAFAGYCRQLSTAGLLRELEGH